MPLIIHGKVESEPMGWRFLGIALIILGIIAIIALAGCTAPSGPALGVISATPASIEVWGNSPIPGGYIGQGPQIATDQEMADLAQQHCQAGGKNAQKESQRADLGVRYVLFHCV